MCVFGLRFDPNCDVQIINIRKEHLWYFEIYMFRLQYNLVTTNTVNTNTVNTNTISVPFKAFSIQMILVNTNSG